MEHVVRRKRKRVRPRLIATRLLMAWVAIVSLYFLWEAERYAGLYAFLAEWQYEHLSHHLPVMTFGLLVLLFGSPAAFLLKIRRRAQSTDSAQGENESQRKAISMSSNFRRALFSFAGGLGCAGLLVLIWTLTLPRVAPPRAEVSIGSAADSVPPLGPITLKGEILYSRTSAFAQSLLFKTRGARFAPIIAPSGTSGDPVGTLRYFVELPPQRPGPVSAIPAIEHRSGVLIANSLPGSIVRLYRYAGYNVDRPFYVLYTSSQTIRWPYYVTAVQLLIAALLALVAGLVQHRHVRHISADPGKASILPE